MSVQPHSEPMSLAKAQLLREAIEKAKVHLANQKAFAAAADRSAVLLVGALCVAIVIGIGVAGSLLNGGRAEEVAGLIAMLVCLGLSASTFFALKAAAPGGFAFAPTPHCDWLEEDCSESQSEAALVKQTHHYLQMLRANQKRFRAISESLAIARRIAVATIVVGIAAISFVFALG